MGLRTFLAIVWFSFAVARSALAGDVTVDPSIATAAAIAPVAVINSDLKPHTWSVHPTAGYFTGTSTVDGAGATATSQGYGGTVQAQYSLSEHFGLDFSGLGFSGSGTYTPGAAEIGGSTGSSSVSGWLVGAALVLDPFSGDGFRLPFFFGVNYQQLSSSTPGSPIITSMTLSTPGYTLGVSPRFNVGFLRFEPFLVVTTPTSKGTVTCSAVVIAGACGAQDIQVLPVFGVDIVFRPWGLSFYFNLSSFLSGAGVAFYSLGPQFRF